MTQETAINNRRNSPMELRRIWNYQQRQIAKECISAEERNKKTLTNREFLVKLAQFGYKLRYKQIVFEVDEENGFSCLTIGRKRIYNATFGDMIAAIERHYGVVPNFDRLEIR